MLPLSFILLLILPSIVNYANLFQCSHSFHHPLLCVVPVFHNIQTNKVAYPCIPCSSNGIILPQACKKLTFIDNNQTKKQNLKTHCVHTIRVTYCPVTTFPFQAFILVVKNLHLMKHQSFHLVLELQLSKDLP
jgi:hypothetical protein